MHTHKHGEYAYVPAKLYDCNCWSPNCMNPNVVWHTWCLWPEKTYIDGIVEDCSNSLDCSTVPLAPHLVDVSWTWIRLVTPGMVFTHDQTLRIGVGSLNSCLLIGWEEWSDPRSWGIVYKTTLPSTLAMELLQSCTKPLISRRGGAICLEVIRQWDRHNCTNRTCMKWACIAVCVDVCGVGLSCGKCVID